MNLGEVEVAGSEPNVERRQGRGGGGSDLGVSGQLTHWRGWEGAGMV